MLRDFRAESLQLAAGVALEVGKIRSEFSASLGHKNDLFDPYGKSLLLQLL